MRTKYFAFKHTHGDHIQKDNRVLSIGQTAQELNALREAVVEAHRILLHELDNGRVPTMLKAEHGGKGLGYFEDLIK